MLNSGRASADRAGTRVAVVYQSRCDNGHLSRSLSSASDLALVAQLPCDRGTVASMCMLRPDVLVVMVADPADTLHLVRRVVTCGHPHSPAVLLVAETAREGFAQALWRGARGLMLRQASADLMINAVRLVAAGYVVVPESMRSGALESWSSYPLPEGTSNAVLGKLTPREVEVLELVANGRSNAEISSTLRLSESTVKSHVQRILGKLGLRNRIGIVILAHDIGLI